MKLADLLNLVENIAKKRNLSTPFLVGGVPRDKVLNKLENITDLDITTGNDDVHELAKELGRILPNSFFKIMDDGHASLTTEEGFKLDFSSNFLITNVDKLLQGSGLKSPNQMQCELYSRDFTCNTLLMTMDLKKILDPTGLALKDIKQKILRTCLPAGITLGMQHKRVVRVLYMAAKLKFKVDPEIIDWVKENPKSIADCEKEYLSKKLQKSMDLDSKITVELIDQMELWKYLPAMSSLIPFMNTPERM